MPIVITDFPGMRAAFVKARAEMERDTQGRASDAEQVEYLERLRAIAGAQPHRFGGTAV